MAQMVNSMSELKRVLQNRAAYALKTTRDEIYKVIQKHITDYYHEKVFYDEQGNPSSIPNMYQRTYQFLNSLMKTEVVLSGNEIGCTVKIDMDSLHYCQPTTTVIDMIYKGYHADTSLNDDVYETPRDIHTLGNFWNDAIEELGGRDGIMRMIKNNLKKCGVPIIN